jgi:quercetin dioxygenase-like cupin family protein
MRRAPSRIGQHGSAAGLVLLAGTLLLVLPWARPPRVVAQGWPPAPGIEATTLATRVLDEVPSDRRWVLRRGHPLNEDAHGHAGGLVYAAAGRTFLVVDETQSTSMEEGRAAWTPEGIGHLHTSLFRASNSGRADATSLEVWTILLERETDARRPGAAATSPPLRGLVPGPYEAQLVLTTFQPWAATVVRLRTGPELAYALDGSWELEYAGVPLTLGAGHGYLADPGVPHRLRNVGQEPARLLSAQLVPAGQPAETPAP